VNRPLDLSQIDRRARRIFLRVRSDVRSPDLFRG
jgi:hypothetical protein